MLALGAFTASLNFEGEYGRHSAREETRSREQRTGRPSDCAVPSTRVDAADLTILIGTYADQLLRAVS